MGYVGAIPNSTLTSEVVTVRMPKTAYVDSVGDDKYTFRVYLTEKSGRNHGRGSVLHRRWPVICQHYWYG